jgi:hypothetical protein
VWGPLLESRFIRRLLFKIQHFTGVEPRNYGNPEKVGTPDEIRLKIIRAIESAAADLLEPGPTPPFGGAAFKSPANPIPVLGNREATRALLSLLEVGNDFHAVLDPDAPDSELLRDLALLDHLRNQGSGKLIVLGPLGYEFYVRIKEPFLYDHLAHERSMRFGEDPIPGISPPPGEAYFNRIVSQFSMALAAFPFGGELLKLSDGPAVMSRVYRSILKRTLLIRYLIEGGQIPRSNGQLNKACYERYSRVFEQFDLLTQSRPSNLAFRMYQVYREHLDFINRNMSKLPSHEGSLRTALL